MGFNVADLDQDNFSFGPGVLFAGISCGECPMIDIGAVRSGAELTVTREKITVEQGSPYQRITDYVIRETIILTVTGIEWRFDNLRRALGAGVVDGDPPVTPPSEDKSYRFGGDMKVASLPLCYRHHTAEGDEIWVKLWCAQGNGEITITFGDDIHEFPYGFTAVQGTKRKALGEVGSECLRAWWNDIHDADGILHSGEHLFEIYREVEPVGVDPCA